MHFGRQNFGQFLRFFLTWNKYCHFDTLNNVPCTLAPITGFRNGIILAQNNNWNLEDNIICIICIIFQGIQLSRFVLIWIICFTFTFLLGRQNTILFFRETFLDFSLRPSPAGSLTAVLYPAPAFRHFVLPFLKTEINCSKEYPLDFALQDFVDEEVPLKSFFVEGDFFDHVGHFSSLGGTKKLNPSWTF